jgi:FixJ family two-component response regulator
MVRVAARSYVFDASLDQTLRKKIVIAVVDDDRAVREALTSLVKSLGYRAVAFQSAEAFLNSKQRHGAACLISDVQMPGMTGPALHARLVESGTPIPAILITAYPDDTVRTRALEAGVKCYLTKPFSEDDLLECIRSALVSHAPGGSGA